MKNLPDIDRMPLGRSILKNCRANASCVNCYVTLSINLPIFHGRNQARDNAQSPLSAPSVRTPAVYCTAASLVLPAVPGCCRIRPPRLACGAVFTGNSSKEKPETSRTIKKFQALFCLNWKFTGRWASSWGECKQCLQYHPSCSIKIHQLLIFDLTSV